MQGRVIVIFGPSGSGKGTLFSYVRQRHPEFVYPVSATTRAQRPQERDGVNYHFLSREAFQERVKNGAFLEWAEFAGNWYGTLKSEILEPLAKGKTVVLEIEVQGVEQLRELLPEEALTTIYIDAGSWEELKARITARAPVSDEELERRYERYQEEVRFREIADYTIHNKEGELEHTKRRLDEIITQAISS